MSARCFSSGFAAVVLAAAAVAAVKAAEVDPFLEEGPLLQNATLPSVLVSEEAASPLENASLLARGAYAARASSLELSWEDCGSAGMFPAEGTITGFSPDRLPLGTKSTLKGSGSLSEPVQGGTVQVQAKAGFVKDNWEADICQTDTHNLPMNAGSMTWHGLKCPLQAGPMDVVADLELSAALPRMLQRTSVTIMGTSSQGALLFCLKLKTSPARRLSSVEEKKDDSAGLLV